MSALGARCDSLRSLNDRDGTSGATFHVKQPHSPGTSYEKRTRETTPGCVSSRFAHSTTDDLFRSLSEERSDETKCRSRPDVRFDSLRSLNDRTTLHERDVSRETAALPRHI